MSQNNPRRRYFVAEGPEAEKIKTKCLKLADEHRERLAAFLEQYGTTNCICRDGLPVAILIEEDKDIPEGFKVDGRRAERGTVYMELKPVGNTKVGKAIKKQMAEVGRFSHSDYMVSAFKCGQLVIGDNGRSMWCSTAWIDRKKDIMVVQVPESDEEPYTPHPCFREIKKSEYIAITEE